MTGNLILDSLISLGAIAVMVIAARLLFGNQDAAVTIDAGAARLAFEEPDFNAAAWLVDGSGRAVLAQNGAGEFALILRLGADLAVRRFSRGGATARFADGALELRLADVTMGPVRIAAADGAAWAGAINADGA